MPGYAGLSSETNKNNDGSSNNDKNLMQCVSRTAGSRTTRKCGSDHARLPCADAPKVSCRVFEDNSGALELANNPKLRPRAKRLAVRLHHFRQCVVDGKINVQHVDTKNQLADVFTKPLPRDTFKRLRSRLCGWWGPARECGIALFRNPDENFRRATRALTSIHRNPSPMRFTLD